jgi:hypothetical protein
MTLLFRLAEWHALAKLRMHTESTLTYMESVTTILGRELRKFRDSTCSAFATQELPKETAARGRRQARNQSKKGPQRTTGTSQSGAKTTTPVKQKAKQLNLSTYKVHALADYVRTIRLFGTTDSYSTQTVSFLVYLSMLCADFISRGSLNIAVLRDFMVARTRTTPSDR